MKSRIYILLGVNVLVCLCLLSHETGNSHSLILCNTEALAYSETNTSWSCDASKKTECCIRCATCNTHVHGTGKQTGTHSCIVTK